MEESQAIGADAAKCRPPPVDKPIRVALCEGRNSWHGVLHDVALLAPQPWDQREIIRSGELGHAMGVPMTELADAAVRGARRVLLRQDGACFVERRLVVVPEPTALMRGEVV